MKWFKLTFFLGNVIAASRFSLIYVAVMVIGITTMSFTDTDHAASRSPFSSLYTAPAPGNTAKFGELNPEAMSFVQEYMRKQGQELERMKKWGKPYFDLYDKILTSYGVPKEMKYLSVIESHLSPQLVSWAGAVGPWQIMPDEAARFGLSTGDYDERTDVKKSTKVAARLMKELYGIFGDWLLVVAAYNGGVNRVKDAIRESGSKNFWKLQSYLPEESRNHVKKFIGTHYIFEGSGGWTTLTAEEAQVHKAFFNDAGSAPLSGEEIDHSILVEVAGRYSAKVITDALGIDIDKFYKWNPGFEKTLDQGKTYSMRLMKDKAGLFVSQRAVLLSASINSKGIAS
ncbi:lytic transglycosylase domain-containing protein [Sediminibacterium roseum]|uniref:Lytic transglycosylase domain-containing protein n=1 Tax=Sediminibacterium roseum TaxID=1978412 RepID=A0ABW9ZYR0_9BACT|nr:lytic transglycosylase domain-containing protein [Sediminibacterium roseum]NCI50333.1 lytic transglycosylase domain-containing protein [Sediminibacterium roseum]